MAHSPPQGALYGGQAVIEGVMIRGASDAVVAVRKPDGEIMIQSLPQSRLWLSRWRRILFLRGIAALAETLTLGMKALALSANAAIPQEEREDDDSGKQETIGGFALGAMIAISLTLAIVVFFIIPLFLSRGLESFGWNDWAANAGEGAIRVVMFIGYIWLIGRMRDIQRLYGYHGAEHMAVHARENGDPLTPEGLRRHPTAHPRCGTAFLLTVVLVSIVAFMFFPRDPLWIHFASRIVLIPVVAAVSYEIIRFNGRHADWWWVKVLAWPSLLLQNLTTKQPDDGQCEVAIASINAAIALDSGQPITGAATAANAGAPSE
ncbi:MAG: DUF1385 domain-containing protein [Chloroflexi bacterium]|nr:DUF1385 domain-containing protein [Chloroflexota bacterium]MCH8236024.1 DUF1385 domain-containing protein [Chloroflexota bacterium]MCH8816425.1 DUF1385 domain-containing protein [Chloroflexota bacterium]